MGNTHQMWKLPPPPCTRTASWLGSGAPANPSDSLSRSGSLIKALFHQCEEECWHSVFKMNAAFKLLSLYFYYKYTLLLLLSHFSRVRLCATPETAAHQAPPSLGYSRQEYWSGLPFPSPMHESEKWKWSSSVMSDSSQPHGLQPTRLLHPWDSQYRSGMPLPSPKYTL